jgi:hypothetical protein
MHKKGQNERQESKHEPKNKPGGGEIFPTGPERPWGTPSFLYNGHRVYSLWLKRPGSGANAEVKEIVEIYLCSPSGHSWPTLGRTLPLPLHNGTPDFQSRY